MPHSDAELVDRHFLMVTTLDEGWDDGDSTSFTLEAHSESTAREMYAMLITGTHERLLAVTLVAPDGLTYLERWDRPKEPVPASIWSDSHYAAVVDDLPSGRIAHCKWCGCRHGDHKGITLECRQDMFELYQGMGGYQRQRWSVGYRFEAADDQDHICRNCGRPHGQHSASGHKCDRIYVEDRKLLEVVPVHPDLQKVADAAKPRCQRVGRGRYEVHDVVSGLTYTFHDTVTRLFRHGDAILGNRRQGVLSFVVMLEAGAQLDLGQARVQPAGRPKWSLSGRDANGNAMWFEGETFESVARQAANDFWSGKDGE